MSYLTYNNTKLTYPGWNGYIGWGSQPFTPVTDIVPLAAFASGAGYLYNKNFSLSNSYTTVTATFQNLNVTNSNKISFQIGAAATAGRCIGGVYAYEGGTQCRVDWTPYSNTMRGVVMFGPSSYYTGAEENRPQMVAMVANTQNNYPSAANIQVGGHCTNNNHFEFDTPLTSNLYGVYGFVSNVDRDGIYGGNLMIASAYTTSGFDFYCYGANGTRVNFDGANFQMVVIQ